MSASGTSYMVLAMARGSVIDARPILATTRTVPPHASSRRLAPRERTSPDHPPICHGCLPINELHDCIPTILKRSRIGLTAWTARTTMGQGFFWRGRTPW